MMKVLIFGSTGMLGHKLYEVLEPRFEVFGSIRSDHKFVEKFGIFDRSRIVERIDVTDRHSVLKALDLVRPAVTINAVGTIKQVAGIRSVPETLLTNAIFPHWLSDCSERFGFKLITISTDCVFSGTRGNYREDDAPDAQDLYGKSKQFGEVEVGNALTLRTSIIGRELQTSNGLFEWMLSKRGEKIKGYRNAIFSGFPTIVLANIISDVIADHPQLTGLYHVSSEPIAKFDLLNLIKKQLGLDIEIEPSDDLKIDRSLDSSKFRKATGIEVPGWEEMVQRMIDDPTPYEKLRS